MGLQFRLAANRKPSNLAYEVDESFNQEVLGISPLESDWVGIQLLGVDRPPRPVVAVPIRYFDTSVCLDRIFFGRVGCRAPIRLGGSFYFI